ncbi:MAG: hypothetical protein ACR2QE_14875 [Acidimicrobiales bacterium]
MTVAAAGVVKTITVVGDDAAQFESFADVTIREQIAPSLVVASKLTDSSEIPPDSDNNTISLSVGKDGTASYRLSVAPGANFGSRETTQESTLVLKEVDRASVTQVLDLDAPLVEMEVQVLAEVSGGNSTNVGVRVRNIDATDLAGPVVLELSASQGTDLITGLQGVSADGELDGNSVRWILDDGIEIGVDEVFSVVADLSAPASDSAIVWRAQLREPTTVESIVEDDATTDVTSPDDGSSGVNFTPGQLIRLIAFVVAFAITALIFGAWARKRSEESTTSESDAREYELRVFRSFTEAIVVLVILVAILVLALQQSLSGESAASLIGVIAGYVLGQSRGSA